MTITTTTEDGRLLAADLRQHDGELQLQYPPPFKGERFEGKPIDVCRTHSATFYSYDLSDIVASRRNGETLFTAREIGIRHSTVSAQSACPIKAIIKVLGKVT